MTAKASLDKDTAGAVEDKAGKELAEKAKQEKKKDKDNVEVARNPEIPKAEKLDSKDVADVLAPPAKEEEKAKEQPEEKGAEKDKQDKEAETKTKEDKGQDKEAEETAGVKKVEDPKKKEEKLAQKDAGGEKVKPKEMGPKDKLVIEGAKAETEEKRSMGDTFFVASLAALMNADRNVLERNVKENGDRSCTVTFYEKDAKAEGGYKPHEVTVVPDGPGKEADEAQSGKSKEDGKSDRLLAVIKQAYVKWKGGEDKVGEGKGGAALEALTGKDAQQEHVDKDDSEGMWTKLVEACTWNQPVLATARGEEVSAIFKESEVKPWHAYVVLKCKEVNGKRMITLRNPFGRAGMAEGNTIEVDLEKFAKLYRSVTVGSSVPEKEAKGKKAEDKKKKPEDEARA